MFGGSEESIDKFVKELLASREKQNAMEKGDGLWPEHAAPFSAFCAAGTQWRMAGGFGFLRYEGLDYAGVEVAHRRLGIELDARQWRDFQVVEREAARLLNERSK